MSLTITTHISEMTSPQLIVRAACRAWADRDIDALREQLDENVLWRATVGRPFVSTHRGRDAVLAAVRRMGEDWSTWEVEIDVVADAGEHVVTVGTLRGRAARTGRSLETRFAQLWTLRDGRVVAHEEVVDSSRLVASLIPMQPSIP
jgi:ketosteroid isomerase-like protein